MELIGILTLLAAAALYAAVIWAGSYAGR